jgi:hypothetical protein
MSLKYLIAYGVMKNVARAEMITDANISIPIIFDN